MTTELDLQRIADLGHVFTVSESGELADAPSGHYAPEVYHSDTEDIEILSPHWEALKGYTGQYSYNGAVMHPSEYIGGRLASDILAAPGTYVVVIVNVLPDECDCVPHVTRMSHFGTAVYCETEQNAYCNQECPHDTDPEPAGWAVLRLKAIV